MGEKLPKLGCIYRVFLQWIQNTEKVKWIRKNFNKYKTGLTRLIPVSKLDQCNAPNSDLDFIKVSAINSWSLITFIQEDR